MCAIISAHSSCPLVQKQTPEINPGNLDNPLPNLDTPYKGTLLAGTHVSCSTTCEKVHRNVADLGLYPWHNSGKLSRSEGQHDVAPLHSSCPMVLHAVDFQHTAESPEFAPCQALPQHKELHTYVANPCNHGRKHHRMPGLCRHFTMPKQHARQHVTHVIKLTSKTSNGADKEQHHCPPALMPYMPPCSASC
jgi:hypothetical protein